MGEKVEDVLRAILAQMEAEVYPRLEQSSDKGGYDCCGCGTYYDIYEGMRAIVKARLADHG